MSYTKQGSSITVTEGNGIDIDNTNPSAPVVNVDPSELSFLQGITAGSNVVIDYTNPVVPIISTTGGGTTPTWQDTLNTGSDLTTDNVVHQDGFSTSFLSSGSLLTFGGGTAPFNIFQVSMVDGTANTWSDIYNTVNQLRLTVRDPTNYDRRIRINTSEILFKSNIFRFDTTDYPTGVGYVWTDVVGNGVMTLRPPAGGGADATTANNGLTKTVDNIQLGGALVQNTTIPVGSFSLTVSTATSAVTPFRVNSTTATAIIAESTDGAAVNGGATGFGIGVWGQSEQGVGVAGQSRNNYGGDFGVYPASANTRVNVVNVNRGTTGTPGVGMGNFVNFQIKNSLNAIANVGKIGFDMTNVTGAAETSDFIINTFNAGSGGDKLKLTGAGVLNLPFYGDGLITGTPTFGAAFDADGKLIEVALGGGGGTTETASNGLNKSVNDIRLGGALTANTTIDAGTSYSLSITGNRTALPGGGLLNIANSFSDGIGATSTVVDGIGFRGIANGYGSGVQGTSLNSYGVNGVSTNSVGVAGTSTSNFGGTFNSTSLVGLAASSQTFNSDYPAAQFTIGEGNGNNGSVLPGVLLRRSALGTPTSGIGVGIYFDVRTITSGDIANKVISKWTDPTHATRTSEFSITGVNSTAPVTNLILSGPGVLTLPSYGDGLITGTPTFGAAFDTNGKLVEVALGGGGATTANNGLTKTVDNIQLGGTLIQNTNINGATFGLNVFNNTVSEETMSISNSGGPAMYVGGGASAHTCSIENLGSGMALTMLANGQTAFLTANHFIGNNIATVAGFGRTSQTAVGNGIGAALVLVVENSVSSNISTGLFAARLTNVTSGAEASELVFQCTQVNTMQTVLTLSDIGRVTLPKGLQDFTDDATAAGGGILVNQLYRTGSVVKIRVT